jgi:acyl-CoA synthetase (AMP-forming)/AMP-acid ligase II
MYTSGTTGRPKGVVISHGNALQNSVTCTSVIGRRESDVELVMVPQFNITGLCSQTVPAMLLGMTSVLLDGFDAVRALDAIGRHGVTSTVGAPTMWWRVLEAAERDGRQEPSRLRLALFGGAPMPTSLIQRMRAAMPAATFGNGYGMTETCSMIMYVGGDDAVARPHTVGRPLPLTELRLVSPDTGEDVAGPGRIGEIVVRGAQVAIGYWTSAGVEPLTDADGWIATGDAAEIEDGFVVLRDRLKDVIKRGGESVFSFEVENCLHQHSGVLDAAVVGVPDEQYGERVVAYVVAKPGHSLSPDEVRAFCREHLAHFKVPSVITVCDELPRNPGGKLIKSLLRSETPAGPAIATT